MLIVNGWKAYHDAVSEGRAPLGFTLSELSVYGAIEVNPGSRQAFLDYFAARENYDRMPHISQGDGVMHRNPADLWLEQAQLAADLGGEIGLMIAQAAYPHDLESQISVAGLIQGIVNVALAHADGLGVGIHVKYPEEPPQYEHGPPAVWDARPPRDITGFGAPSRSTGSSSRTTALLPPAPQVRPSVDVVDSGRGPGKGPVRSPLTRVEVRAAQTVG